MRSSLYEITVQPQAKRLSNPRSRPIAYTIWTFLRCSITKWPY